MPDGSTSTGAGAREGVVDDSWSDAVLDAVRRAASKTHVILGELGRNAEGLPTYLARELASESLTLLQLDREPGSAPDGQQFTLTESRELDASIPAPPSVCGVCHARVDAWARQCAACGADVSGLGGGAGDGLSREELLAAVQGATGGTYKILGELHRAAGGGTVFFARVIGSDRLVALRLSRDAGDREGEVTYSVGVTPFMTSLGAVEESAGDQSRPDERKEGTDRMADRAGTPPRSAAIRQCPQCGTEYGPEVSYCPRDGASVEGVGGVDLLVGQLLSDRYRVVRKLGEGGMGQVYLAEHVNIDGRLCAIKVMRRSLAHDADIAARFRREAANTSRITHQNVAVVYDFGETADGVVYLAMEYVDGQPLSALLAREGRFRPERVAAIGRQIAEALGAAHDLGIVHRDLKPDNVMIVKTRHGHDHVKVVDFGIAKAIQADGKHFTRTGFVLGTPAYMSPEQLIGEPLDGRSDLYSLGCILYELLTAESPFASPSGESAINRRLTLPPPHPRSADPTVPKVLDQIVVKLLARSPTDRFQSAAAVSEALSTPLSHWGRDFWARIPGLRKQVEGRTRGARRVDSSLPTPRPGTAIVVQSPRPRATALAAPASAPLWQAPRSPPFARPARATQAGRAEERPGAAATPPADSRSESDTHRRRRAPLVSIAAGAIVIGVATVLLLGRHRHVPPAAEERSTTEDTGSTSPASVAATSADSGNGPLPVGPPTSASQSAGNVASSGDSGSAATPSLVAAPPAAALRAPPASAESSAAEREFQRARETATVARRQAVVNGVATAALAVGDSLEAAARAFRVHQQMPQAIAALGRATEKWRGAERVALSEVTAAHRDSNQRPVPEPSAPQVAAPLPAANPSPDTAAAVAESPAPTRAPSVTPSVAPLGSKDASADSAQVPVVTGVLERYVQALNDKAIDRMRRAYPTLPDDTQRGFEALFKIATTFSATLSSTPTPRVSGAEAESDLDYVLHYFTSNTGSQRLSFHWHATLHRGGSGWEIQSLQLQR